MLSNDMKIFLNYLEEVQEVNYKTIRNYKHCLEEMNDYLFSNTNFTFNDVKNLKISIIQKKWLNVLRDNGMCSSTINLRIVTLTRLFTYMIGEGLADNNIGKLIPKYKGNKRNCTVVDINIAKKILDSCEKKKNNDKSYINVRDDMLIKMMLSVGMRKSEVLYLTLDDVHPNGRINIVRHNKNDGVKFGKNRIVYLPKSLLKDLRFYINMRKNMYSVDNSFFISSTTRRRLSSSTIQKIFKNILKENNLPNNIHLHELRENFVSNVINETGNVAGVQKVVGHSNSRVTLDRYYKADMNELQEVSDSNPLFA